MEWSVEVKAASVAGMTAIVAAVITASITSYNKAKEHEIARRRLVLEEARLARDDSELRLLKSYMSAAEKFHSACPDASSEGPLPREAAAGLLVTAVLLHAWQNNPLPVDIPQSCSEGAQLHASLRDQVIESLRVVR